MLDCAGRWFDKPTDLPSARRQLQDLRSQRHQLFNGMVVARAGKCLWRHSDVAMLEMRNFSDVFLDEYLAQVGDRALWSVGGYQIEGRGAQLFTTITGDFFSILGLPLLPLLAVLREHGVIHS
jgi:septum formation protein